MSIEVLLSKVFKIKIFTRRHLRFTRHFKTFDDLVLICNESKQPKHQSPVSTTQESLRTLGTLERRNPWEMKRGNLQKKIRNLRKGNSGLEVSDKIECVSNNAK